MYGFRGNLNDCCIGKIKCGGRLGLETYQIFLCFCVSILLYKLIGYVNVIVLISQ